MMAFKTCIMMTLLTIVTAQRHMQRAAQLPQKAYTSVVPMYSAPPYTAPSYKAPANTAGAPADGGASSPPFSPFLGGHGQFYNQPQVLQLQAYQPGNVHYYQGQTEAESQYSGQSGVQSYGGQSGSPGAFNAPTYNTPSYKQQSTGVYSGKSGAASPHKSQAESFSFYATSAFKEPAANLPSYYDGQKETASAGQTETGTSYRSQPGGESYSGQSGFIPSFKPPTYKQPSAHAYSGKPQSENYAGYTASNYRRPSAQAPSHYDVQNEGSYDSQTEAGLFYKSQSGEESYSGQAESAQFFNDPSYKQTSTKAYSGKSGAASAYKGQSGVYADYAPSNYKQPPKKTPGYYNEQNDGFYDVQAGPSYSSQPGESYGGQSASVASFNAPNYNAPFYKQPSAENYGGKTGTASSHKSNFGTAEAFNAPAYKRLQTAKGHYLTPPPYNRQFETAAAPDSSQTVQGSAYAGQSGQSPYNAPSHYTENSSKDDPNSVNSSISFTIGSAN